MNQKEFRAFLGMLDQIGLVCSVVRMGRGNYSQVYGRYLRFDKRICRSVNPLFKNPDWKRIRVKRQSNYRRKYLAIINGEIHGPYCRKISAKDCIIKAYENKMAHAHTD